MTITQEPDDDKVRQMLASYKQHNEEPPMSVYVRDPDKVWAILVVGNTGRRKVRLAKIGWVPSSGRGFTIHGGFFEPGWLPCDIEEGDAKEFPIEESELTGVLAMVAWDRLDRGYYAAFERSWRGGFLWCKVLLHIAPYN